MGRPRKNPVVEMVPESDRDLPVDEAEVVNNDMEAYSNTQVQRFNPIAEKIASFAQFKQLAIKDTYDVQGYKKVRESRIEVMRTRTSSNKIRLAITEDARRLINDVNKVYNDKILTPCTDIERDLQEKEDWYVAEKERIAAEEKKRVEERVQERVNRLNFTNLAWNGMAYVTIEGEIIITMEGLETMTDENFNTIVEPVEREAEIARERKAFEEQEKARKYAEMQSLLEEKEREARELFERARVENAEALRKEQEIRDRLVEENENIIRAMAIRIAELENAAIAKASSREVIAPVEEQVIITPDVEVQEIVKESLPPVGMQFIPGDKVEDNVLTPDEVASTNRDRTIENIVYTFVINTWGINNPEVPELVRLITGLCLYVWNEAIESTFE